VKPTGEDVCIAAYVAKRVRSLARCSQLLERLIKNDLSQTERLKAHPSP